MQQELKQTRPFRTLGQEASVALLRTADVVRRRLSTVVEPSGITLQQYNVLRILRGARGKPMPTLELGSRLIEHTPGITGLLDRLEEKELVRRERCPEDRRKVHCYITPRGLDLLDQLDPAILAADRKGVGDLQGRELEVLIGLLDRIRAAEP